MALYNKPIQDEILKSYTKEQIRKIYDDKIKELSENGFYIDLICELYARLKTSHLPNSSTSRAWSVYDRPHLEDRISKGVNFRCSSGIVKNVF